MIVSDESYVAYERHKILSFLEGKIKERDLYWRNQDFYKNNSIELLLDREVVELNLNKKKAVFKDRDFVEFDLLLIAAGAKVALPKLPGIQKEGVVALNGLKDVKYILDNLPIAHTVIVAGSGHVAEELARIIAAKKIEVKFLGPMGPAHEGVDMIPDNPISEILGDSEAKAVRLVSQKVIGASLVIFPRTEQPNISFIKGTDIEAVQRIVVDGSMRTNIPFVLAAGDACEFRDKPKVCGWENAVNEGRLAGRTICQI